MGLDIIVVPVRIGEVMDMVVKVKVVIKYSGKNNCAQPNVERKTEEISE